MNRFVMARSELLSTFFPTWIWQGRMWSKWRIPKYDPYYWIVADAHPVTSTYYPLAIVSSIIGSFSRMDMAFLLLISVLIFHFVGSFIGWFLLIKGFAGILVSLFGAITFTFAGYNWKQQPCYQYTIAWFPWLLLSIAQNNVLLGGFSLGMIILAGYYPIGLQIVLIAIGACLLWSPGMLWFLPIGLVIGSIQLIPFLKYLPKTIRVYKHDNIGKVPWWHFISLLLPTSMRQNINGVGFWEMSYYVGIVPLVLSLLGVLHMASRVWILGVVSILLSMGMFSRFLPRIPARWLFTFQFSLVWIATASLASLCLSEVKLWCLILIQVADLYLNNRQLLVHHPYAELYQKPSRAFNTELTRYLEADLGQNRVSGLPYPIFTGHINGLRTLGYSGGMQLKLMAKWRNDTNPNGSGEHDYFRRNSDDTKLDLYRVTYAYTSKKLNWLTTPIKKLWANPRLSTADRK